MGLLLLPVFSMLFHRPTLSLGNKTDKALKHYMKGHKNSVSAFQSGAWGNSYNVMQSSWIKCFQFLCLCLQNILFQLFIYFLYFFSPGKKILFPKWFLQLQIKFSKEKYFFQEVSDQGFYRSSQGWKHWLIAENSQSNYLLISPHTKAEPPHLYIYLVLDSTQITMIFWFHWFNFPFIFLKECHYANIYCCNCVTLTGEEKFQNKKLSHTIWKYRVPGLNA